MTARRLSSITQRGAVSVEFALLLPMFLILIVGGVHLGRALTTRHRLTDATNFAVRAAAVRGTTNAAEIRTLLQGRLGGAATDCSTLAVTASTATDAVGLTRLEITAVCTLAAGFGHALLGAIGPSNLTVTAAMPFP
jgi:Flp pilus assembly protein TadG